MWVAVKRNQENEKFDWLHFKSRRTSQLKKLYMWNIRKLKLTTVTIHSSNQNWWKSFPFHPFQTVEFEWNLKIHFEFALAIVLHTAYHSISFMEKSWIKFHLNGSPNVQIIFRHTFCTLFRIFFIRSNFKAKLLA